MILVRSCVGRQWLGGYLGLSEAEHWVRFCLFVVCVVLLVFVLEDCSFDVQDGRCCMACGECLLHSGV